MLFFQAIPRTAMALDSDSDSDYGARGKKKKRFGGVDVRQSHRGSKSQTYQEGEHYGDDFEDNAPMAESSYYMDAEGMQYEEDHEIEAVLNHSRDEGREEDPEDLWSENIVGPFLPVCG